MKPLRRARGAAFTVLLGYATLMPLLASGLGLWTLPAAAAWLEATGFWAVPIFITVTAAALTLALMPSTVMAALAGVLFGIPGLVTAVASYLLASALAFEIVRRLLGPAAQRAVRRSARARAVQAELRPGTFRIVALSRLSPVLPFALVNALLALSPVGRPIYLVGSLIGMLPRTAGAVTIGAAAGTVLAALGEGGARPCGVLALGSVLSALAAAATLALLWCVARALRRALAPDEHPPTAVGNRSHPADGPP